MRFLEEVDTEQLTILYHNDRYLLYSTETGKPIVSTPFTIKRITAYLVDLMDAEYDEDEIYAIAIDIGKARATGVFGSPKSFAECIALNKLGAGGEPIPYEQFIATYFQKGGKGVYRCECCLEAVKVSDDYENFSGNGGLLPVSAFCVKCREFNFV